MYLGEIHGKLSQQQENREDILTSNVFSFFKYTDRKLFLRRFLNELVGLNVTPEEARQAEFLFWPQLEDGTEPDLVIIVGDYYLLIETKYFSGFGQETHHNAAQLSREIEQGELAAHNLGKSYRILTITAHYSFSRAILNGLPKQYHSQIKWINWQKIAFFLYLQIENSPDLPIETKLFAGDLYKLLVRKKLRNFEGVRALSDLPKLTEFKASDLFFELKTAKYRGQFTGFQKVLPRSVRDYSIPKSIFRRDQNEPN